MCGHRTAVWFEFGGINFVRELGSTVCCAIECGRIGVWFSFVYFPIATLEAIIDTWPNATTALRMTWDTFAMHFVGVVIGWTLVFALFATLVSRTFLTNLLMETVTGTTLASWMTFPTNRFAGQRFQNALLLWNDPFVVVTIYFSRYGYLIVLVV